MSKIDDRGRSVGPDDEPPRGLRERLARLLGAFQDRLWADHEKWTADCGYDSWRSPSGWTAYGHDPRFNLRQVCDDCDGTGCHRITGAECLECDGVGVVTLDPPEEGEWR